MCRRFRRGGLAVQINDGEVDHILRASYDAGRGERSSKPKVPLRRGGMSGAEPSARPFRHAWADEVRSSRSRA